MNSSIKNGIASFAIVWCLVFSLFTGLLVMVPSQGEALLPSFLENGDVIIGSDYVQSTWTLDLNGGTHYMDGNLTIRAGGTVTIINGAFAFTQDCGMDAIPGTADDHVYTLIVEDGGRLVLDQATLTTHLNQVFDFPSLGVLVQNGGSIEATDSTFEFPGHIVVDDSFFIMSDSVITGHASDLISMYCNGAYFPPDSFDDSAVFFAISSTCRFVSSRVENIFEGAGGGFGSSYAFASDTAAKDFVTYTLGRHVNSFTAANTAQGLIANLTQSDQAYVTVSPGQTLSLGSMAMDGLTFPSSASYAITMKVSYLTDLGYDGTNAIAWNYQNGATTPTTIVPSETHSAYDPSLNTERIESFTMPSMSSADLGNLNITFSNNAATAAIYYNKIWFDISFARETYHNISFGGTSAFTAIDTFLDVDFSSDLATHNQLNVVDAAKAYLYGVYGNTVTPASDTAYFIQGIAESIIPISKNAIDDTGGTLSSLRSVDGSYYTVAQNDVLAIENFNSGGLVGSLTGVQLVVSVRTASGYVAGPFVQWGTSWSALKNTSIQPYYNGATPETFTYNLYSAGVNDLSSLNNLKIGFINPRVQSVQFDSISVIIETAPAVYVYRWAEVATVDQQGLPISGAYVNASLLAGGAAAYYYTPGGIQATPPIEVLSYLGKNSADYMMTNGSGAVRLPLLSELLSSTDQLPNMQVILGYSLNIEYTNVSSIQFSGTSTVAFEIYPAIALEDQSQPVDFTMPDLYLDKPDLIIDAISLFPSTIYLGDATTISVFVRNAALTGANNVAVNVTDSLSAWSREQIVAFIGPGSTIEVQYPWTANPAGLHTISAKADPKNYVLEGNENNNERSLQISVLANLPELSVVTGDISFNPQPAFSGSPVTTTVLVSNALGRANADNVVVSFYIGDPRISGQLIGTTIINVTMGGANTTTFVWTPTEIGTYNIYVWVNEGRAPSEYSYTNNVASRSIIVDLSIQSTDLVVDDNDVLVFSGTDFNHRGRIIVMEQGTLIIETATFTVDQDYDNQFQVYVMDSGTIILDEATFTSSNIVWVYLNENAELWINDSVVSGMVKIKMDGTSALNIDRSSIGAELVAPTSSFATLNAMDSSFTRPLTAFGGNAVATLVSISIPSISAKESSVVYHYRTIDVTVTDEAENIIIGANVQLRWYVNKTVVDSAVSGINGQLSFNALCDVINASGVVYYGTYELNCTYSFMGTTYYADNQPVSLNPYSSPLAQEDPQVTLVLHGVIPLSSWDLIVDDNDIVTLEGTTFTHRGRIIIMESGTLRIMNGGLVISQAYNYEFQIFVQDNGKLQISSATLNSNQLIKLYASGNAQITVDASIIYGSIRIEMADNSLLTIRESTVGSAIAATGSVVVWAWNSTFQSLWTAFGGDARAYLVSNNMPGVQPIEGAVVYTFRWVEVTVLDGNNYPLPNTLVQMRYYINGTLFDSELSKSNGKALFAALCDRIDAGNNNFLGNYRVNATYWYAGQAYQTIAPVPVSLTPYSQPLVVDTERITISIPGALPNLDPPLFASNTNPYRGDTVNLTTQVHNGGVVAAYNVLVRFLDGSTVIRDVTVDKIDPATTVTVYANWIAQYPLGQHNISVVVDPFNMIKELNKNDNSDWIFVNVRGIAELYISSSDVSLVPSSPTTNTSVGVTLTVHNSGDIAASNVNVSFVDIRPNGVQVLLGYRIISSVPALGGTGVASLTWTPNIPGNHNLLIKVNVGVPPITEHDTSNNNVTYPVIVLNYADLTPSSITYRPLTAIYVGNSVFIDAAVTNIGQTTAANVIVNFWEGAVGTGRQFDTKTVASVPAGQTVVVTATWLVQPIPGDKIQTRTITVDVNPTRTVTETNYNNNRLAQNIVVVDNRPDLMFVGGFNVTSAGVLVDQAVIGESVVLKVTVKNDGYTSVMGAKIRFEAIDSDSLATMIAVVSRDIQANQTIQVDLPWIVNVTTGNFTLVCTLDPGSALVEVSESNNMAERSFLVLPPDPAMTIATDQPSYDADEDVITFGTVTNSRTDEPLANVRVVLTLLNAGNLQKIGDNTTITTDVTGYYEGVTPIPANAQSGSYMVQVDVIIGSKVVTDYSAAFQVEAPGVVTSMPWWVWLLIIIVVLAVIIGFSIYLYKYGLGRMVECGECGALIPESSKRCPKCGVEFETGTAKCSQCGAWIPASSSQCPECGVKFVSEPLAEEETEYVHKMREQYDAYANPYREQAKQVLGKKYSEAKFQEWWKKQPSYISFEKWLSQEEEKRKAAGAAYSCPVCGTPNPKGSNICSKCGTVFDKALMAEAGATGEPSKPTRRIVKRPVEKKALPKKPEEGGEQLSEPQPEEPKNP